MMHTHTRVRAVVAVLLLAVLVAGCASRSYRRGEAAARAGDWDAAVEHYRRAVQERPDRADIKIALERAMISASQQHLEQARILEARGQLEDALREYRRASSYDPPNRQLAAQVIDLERRIRDQFEAARPPSSIQQLREQARQAGPAPLVNLTTILPGLRFSNTSLRDILGAIGKMAQINVTYDNTFQDRTYSVEMDNVTLEEALNQIVQANQLFYKVVNQRTIIVVPDNPAKRQQYEELVIRTFLLSHADAQELGNLINGVARLGGTQVQPFVAFNKTANSITVRATATMMAIIERIVEVNDKPRAEVIVDVQILEVSRNRARQFGLDLGEYAIGTVFSPEADPRSAGTGDGAGQTTMSPRPFNLNTVSRGVNTSDFYLAVPSAVVRFLEADVETRVVAKPQLRGAEGRELILNLGERIPIPSTTFTPIAQGGANFNPLTSLNYENIGVNVRMTPRVTYEGDIILDLEVENSAVGPDRTVAGTTAPSFTQRKVTTRLRLREGESSLLAGLLREDERRALRGIPGIVNVPILRSLFASNDQAIQQTDIVMLLTPRIVRTHELTVQDLEPLFIGTQSNLGLGGPPPLIAQPDAAAEPPAQPQPEGAPGPPPAPPAAGGVPVAPPGSSPVPGPPSPAGPAGSSVRPGAPGGQVVVSAPPDVRLGGGPYTIPVSLAGASRVSSIALTLTYNPAVLRVRSVQEGAFMRSGGVPALFTPQVDAAAGRIDLVVVRTGDTTGVAGTGTVAAFVFETVGSGPANLALSGSGSAPGGAALALEFAPVPAVMVR